MRNNFTHMDENINHQNRRGEGRLEEAYTDGLHQTLHQNYIIMYVHIGKVILFIIMYAVYIPEWSHVYMEFH